MTREQYKQNKPLIEHWASGARVEMQRKNTAYPTEWFPTETPFDSDTDKYNYRLSPTHIRVPLTMQDFLKGGPWWLRLDRDDKIQYLITEVIFEGVVFGDSSFKSFQDLLAAERMSASSPTASFAPCYKEK